MSLSLSAVTNSWRQRCLNCYSGSALPDSWLCLIILTDRDPRHLQGATGGESRRMIITVIKNTQWKMLLWLMTTAEKMYCMFTKDVGFDGSDALRSDPSMQFLA